MNDIQSKEDIILFVNSFYGKVQKDTLIGPVFTGKIPDDKWPIHLEKMYRFWNSILFRAQEYTGNPFARHISLGIEKVHFDRWLLLFESVISENFKGPKADEAVLRAQNMGALFESKLSYMRDNPDRFGVV